MSAKPKTLSSLLVVVDPKGVRSIRGQRTLYDRIRPHLEAIDAALAGRSPRVSSRPTPLATRTAAPQGGSAP
jgi:hypothetical protein